MTNDGARGFLLTQLDTQSTAAGAKALSTSDQLKSAAVQFRGDDRLRPAAPLADAGAQALARVGRYLRESDGAQLVADGEGFARRRRWMLASAGLVLGFASSRILKSAVARRARRSDADGRSTGTAVEVDADPSIGILLADESSTGTGANYNGA
jgi:hypothetical protein